MENLQDLSMSASEERRIHDEWNTYGKVINQLATQGFRTLGTPQYAYPGYIDLDVLASHDSRMLTGELAKNKAWKDYTAQLVTYSNMILNQTSNELKDIEREMKKRLRAARAGAAGGTKTPTKEEIVEKALTDPRYRQLSIQRQEHEQLKEAYDAEIQRFAGNYALVSRCITLRGQDIEEGNRLGNVGAEGAGGGNPFA